MVNSAVALLYPPGARGPRREKRPHVLSAKGQVPRRFAKDTFCTRRSARSARGRVPLSRIPAAYDYGVNPAWMRPYANESRGCRPAAARVPPKKTGPSRLTSRPAQKTACRCAYYWPARAGCLCACCKKLTIYAGTLQIRVPNQGQAGTKGGPPGHMWVNISVRGSSFMIPLPPLFIFHACFQVAPSAVFRRDGVHVHSAVPIS